MCTLLSPEGISTKLKNSRRLDHGVHLSNSIELLGDHSQGPHREYKLPNPSDDLSKYLWASLAILPIHDDPYMKVMQADNATSDESPIPPQAPIAPPTALPPSPVLPLSPMFDSQDFFLLKEILPPKKRAYYRSSFLLAYFQYLRLEKNCRNKGPATGSNLQPVSVTCHDYREKEHYRNQCPKANNSAHGRAYMLRDKNARQDPNVVMGTFLLNQHLAKVLFDSGADKSFVSISLASMLNILPITLDTTYDIEMANGNLVCTNTVIQGCTLILLNQPFEIGLMLIKLGSFDIVIGMDWLSMYHA
ncbi:putative reverse transcriptase domain-containing protein [Tanacetum coccineum]